MRAVLAYVVTVVALVLALAYFQPILRPWVAAHETLALGLYVLMIAAGGLWLGLLGPRMDGAPPRGRKG